MTARRHGPIRLVRPTAGSHAATGPLGRKAIVLRNILRSTPANAAEPSAGLEGAGPAQKGDECLHPQEALGPRWKKDRDQEGGKLRTR